jgi:serine/threonine protein kinase
MMSVDPQQARELFIAAIKLAPEQWAGYLDKACGPDKALHSRVRHLLEAYRQADSFLEEDTGGSPATVDEPDVPERPGAVLGPYKLLEQIGEGGFGVVFVAEQQQPIRRKVALKVLKPGMDTRQVIARFEAERQALALMDHPNIAKVLDAGRTSRGRPYFVMELVRGLPITAYCDQSQLSPRERLELFVHVCQAVQHAHQKGIIHRDLKPSNMLVMMQDGEPLVKVIDFGIAKALGQQLTDKTLHTGFAQIIGTPLYMSPEQTALSNVDVDTRSDIYSLGVILYELLTGTTPFDRKRFQEADFEVMRRIIREEEPVKPSTRISMLGQAAASVSEQRKSDPKALSGLFRGELDWIVMKALEKDRNRRYETASGFAADVRRYLHDEPVLACPPSATYQFRKFARRHKRGFAAVGIVCGLLATAVVVLLFANYHITQQRNLAQREHERAETNLTAARAAVDDYLTTVSESRLLKSSLPGLQPLRKELLQTALHYYQGFVRENQDDPALRFELASATFRVGVITAEIESQDKGLTYLVEARNLFQGLADSQPANVDYQAGLGNCLLRIGFVLSGLGKGQDANASFQEGIAILEAIVPQRADDNLLRANLAFGHHYLSLGQVVMGKYEEGGQHSRRAIELRQNLVERNPSEARYREDLALSLNNLSYALHQAGRTPEALQNSRKAEDTARALVREHPRDASMRGTLALIIRGQATMHRSLGNKDESFACFRESVEILDKVALENPVDINLRRMAAEGISTYGELLVDEDRLESAKQALAKAQEHAEIVLKDNPKNVRTLSALSAIHRNRGKILGKQGKPAEALDELRRAVAIDERIAPEGAVLHYNLACSLAQCSAMAARARARAEAQRYADRAIEELRKAWDRGYKELKGMERDPDLDALRSRSDFKEFIRSAQENTISTSR